MKAWKMTGHSLKKHIKCKKLANVSHTCEEYNGSQNLCVFSVNPFFTIRSSATQQIVSPFSECLVFFSILGLILCRELSKLKIMLMSNKNSTANSFFVSFLANSSFYYSLTRNAINRGKPSKVRLTLSP